MKIIYKTGDMLDGPESFICHGCNAQGEMGSGVAKAIRARYPYAYDVYRMEYERNGLRLGQTLWAECNPHVVINAITQQHYGRNAVNGAVYVSYDGIRAAIREINGQIGRNSGHHVAFPLIGAGLAGGSWKTISAIIEEESTNFYPVVYLLDGVIPNT